MQQVFATAIYHTEPTVLGKKLLPLSLGHVFALMAVESPYVCHGPKGLWDLSLAVAICSHTWEGNQRWFKSGKILADFKRWGKQCRKLNFVAEHWKFKTYFDHYTQFPERNHSEGMKPSRHPWPLMVANSLVAKVGEERAWNMPLPLAVSYWSADAEMQGDDSLKSDRDKAMFAEQQEYAAKLRANLEKLGKVTVKGGE